MTDEEYKQMMKDEEEMYREEEKQQQEYEKFLKTKKALTSSDEYVRKDAEEFQLKDTKTRLMVKFEGNKKFTNSDYLHDNFKFHKFNEELTHWDFKIAAAKQYIERWNNSTYSWGRKIIDAKIQYVSQWDDTVKKTVMVK